jgi:CRISPR-associated protein Csm5
MATTTYTLTCLSPVHVGSGRRWSKFDGAYEGQRWHVVDLDRVLARAVDATELASEMSGRDFSWGEYLRKERLPVAEVAVYSLPCPDNPADVTVREALKDIDQRPYVPGSSIKGAIRTALLWRLMQELDVSGWTEKLGSNRSWLAQPLERAVFGKSPNHDLLRALHVGDSSAAAAELLGIGLVWTYTLRNRQLIEKRENNSEHKIYVEWLPPGTKLTTGINLDTYLFGARPDELLHFSGPKEQAVRQLASTCNKLSQAIIQAEKVFFAAHQLEPIRSFYSDLENVLTQLGAGSFLLNIGWGGGWEVKTVGQLVQQALGSNRWRELRDQFGLGRKPGTRQIDWQAPFPKTRRVAYHQGKPFGPMGWVLLSPPGEEAPVSPRWSAATIQRPASRNIGTPVTVKVLARHEKGPKGSFFVQEEGQPRGVLCHGIPPRQLPEIDQSITVYISSMDPRSPQYRWNPPAPPDRGRGGRGSQSRGKR